MRGSSASRLPSRSFAAALGVATGILVPAHAARALETHDLAGWWIAIDEVFPVLWRRGDIVAMEELLVISPDERAANRMMTFNPPNPVTCVDAGYCSDAPLVATTRLTLKGDLLTVREWKPTTVRIAGDKTSGLDGDRGQVRAWLPWSPYGPSRRFAATHAYDRN
jgi:hypothetical protein